MRAFFVATVVFASLFVSQTFAEDALTPKATISLWTKDGATWTVDDLRSRLYYAQGEKETKLAKAMAADTSVLCKLQDAVHAKWGKAAEVAYARLIVTDTLEDDKAASETVDGNHATITFTPDTQIPVGHLIKIDGVWKTDMSLLMKDLGDEVDKNVDYHLKSAKVLQTAIDRLSADQYKDSADLITFLKTEYDKFAP